jgi:hypothetical protein
MRPVEPGDDCPPYLVFDGLAAGGLRPVDARKIVRAILERKYGDRCPPGYIDMVVSSFRDDPVRLRLPLHAGSVQELPLQKGRSERIALVVNDRHEIHHVRERGYVESPVRISAILRELDRTDLFMKLSPRRFSQDAVTAVHDQSFVRYFRT